MVLKEIIHKNKLIYLDISYCLLKRHRIVTIIANIAL